MKPRVAMAQAPHVRDPELALARLGRQMQWAAERGAEVILFPEWYLGLNPVEPLPNRWVQAVGHWARELGLLVVTGSVRALDPETGKKQQRGLVIDRDGRLVGTQAKLNVAPVERPWFEPGNGLNPIATRLGCVVLLLGLDALDAELWREALHLGPDLVVMTALARSPHERDALRALAVTRSRELRGLVAWVPLMGRFSGSQHVGGGVLAQDGELVLAAEDQEGVWVLGEVEAPTVQLGVTDVSASLGPKREVAPEAERRVVADWRWLRSSDWLPAAQAALEAATDNPRQVVLVPIRPGTVREVERLLAGGAGGGFTCPGIDRVYPWSDAFMQVGAALQRARRPMVVETVEAGAPLRFARPVEWDDFLFSFPDVPVVFLHLGGRSPFFEEALRMAERHRQVWLETSEAPPEAVREAWAALGPERLVFGSGGSRADFSREWGKWQALAPDLPSAGIKAVVNANGRRLFFDPGQVEERPKPFQVLRPG
ncbi:MAG: amidohydrolase family protein [Firmicutes bacterium]|nr:amidohydrolase family protein [Alicyclobacillaceae bacterium]MCL6496194.1 amidohydrolase family protein [Bacillota bacterium]